MAEANSTVVYKDIPGFPGYRAGSDGSVWSCWSRGGTKPKITDRWRQLKPWLAKRPGRLQIGLAGKAYSVHRVILLTFIGPCPPGMEACHNDGNRLNNVPTNLRWDTHQANVLDRFKHGTMMYGEKTHNARFTDEDVRTMRLLHATGKISYSELGLKYGVHWSYIRAIVKRRVWKHVA